MLSSLKVKRFTHQFAIILCLVLCLSYSKGDSTRTWDADNKLTWSDFKDTTLTNSHRAALTDAGIILDAQPNGPGQYTITAYSIMNKSKSWVDISRKSDYILSHEQYHFNITEYWCRKMKQDVVNTHFTLKNFKDKLSSIRREDFGALQEMEVQYDRETNHSIIHEQQAKWEKRVDALLKETEKFAGNNIQVSLK